MLAFEPVATEGIVWFWLVDLSPALESSAHTNQPLLALVAIVAFTPVVVLNAPDERFWVNESELPLSAIVKLGGTLAETVIWSFEITSVPTVAVSPASARMTEYWPVADGLVTALAELK